jgi:hypothetical protein
MKTVLIALVLVLCNVVLLAQDKQIPDNFQRTELYFGRNIGGHKKMTNRDWKKFVEDSIIIHLSGFTILDGNGYWNNRGKAESEKSKVLILIHVNSPEFDAKIERIREAYKTRFKQNSVLRVDCPVRTEE